MNASRLSINEGDDNVLHAAGVIDAHTASTLQAAIDAHDVDTDVTLDLSDITFIDSSGLRIIVAAHQRFDDAGHRLVLHRPSDAVQRLFGITGLTDHLHITS